MLSVIKGNTHQWINLFYMSGNFFFKNDCHKPKFFSLSCLPRTPHTMYLIVNIFHVPYRDWVLVYPLFWTEHQSLSHYFEQRRKLYLFQPLCTVKLIKFDLKLNMIFLCNIIGSSFSEWAFPIVLSYSLLCQVNVNVTIQYLKLPSEKPLLTQLYFYCPRRAIWFACGGPDNNNTIVL